jgi:hypothetical protein
MITPLVEKVPSDDFAGFDVEHHGRQWYPEFDGVLGAVQNATVAMPAFFRVFDDRNLFGIATGKNVGRADFGAKSAGFAFIVVNDGRHGYLLNI